MHTSVQGLRKVAIQVIEFLSGHYTHYEEDDF